MKDQRYQAGISKPEIELKEISSENYDEYHEIERSHNLLPSSSKNSAISFDEILDRVGFGKYHVKLFIILGLLGMADGSESMVISFTVPVFKKHFNPSFSLEAALGTSIYVGYFIGSLLSGYFSDKYGRRRPVIYSNALMLVLGLLSAFPPNLEVFIVLRGLFGIIVGFFSPLAYTIMAEITPLKYRGKYMVLLGVFYTLGELVSCVVAIFTLDDLTSGNWHALLAWSTLPALVAWICSLFLLDESARHEMFLGNYQNGINILNKMYQENKGPTRDPISVMTQEEEEQLVSNYKNLANHQTKEQVPLVSTVKELYQGENKKVTPFVWVNWFANALTFFGLTYLLPTTISLLDAENGNSGSSEDLDDYNVSSVVYSSLSALPTVFVAALLVDLKHFGRKNSLSFAFLLGGVICVIASFQVWPGFVFWVSITKFFFSLAYTINYEFTSELYPTRIRGTGIGIASAFGRIGSIIMPSVSSWLEEITPLAPYKIYGAGAILAGLSTQMIPFDTAKLHMDTLDSKL